MRDAPTSEGGSPVGPPLSVFGALTPKLYLQCGSEGSRAEPPKFFFLAVFGSIMMSSFAVHGIEFFGPWFSHSSIGIRVS